MKKTPPKSSRRTVSPKTGSKTVRRTNLKKKTTPPKTSRFWCDCMMGIAVAIALTVGGQSLLHQLTDRTTRVLGVSTKLDTTTIVQNLNLERAKAGLGPLVTNDQLTQAAVAKGENMFQDDYWAHVNPDGTEPWTFIQATGYAYQSAGENLARDFGDEQQLVAAWMDSSSHRANILNGNFTEVGLAVLDGQIQGKNALLVVNFFAQPQTSAGLIPATASYDADGSETVLAGRVVPSQVTAVARPPWRGWQVGLAAGVLVGIGSVLGKIRPARFTSKARRA